MLAPTVDQVAADRLLQAQLQYRSQGQGIVNPMDEITQGTRQMRPLSRRTRFTHLPGEDEPKAAPRTPGLRTPADPVRSVPGGGGCSDRRPVPPHLFKSGFAHPYSGFVAAVPYGETMFFPAAASSGEGC